ncbi:sigma-70 family RNA polymerase sigma factor [Nocardiopsis dassonvillei]|uniref:sigma-70 family RNA polymerase sigma factor n=1 Tax=Nocardiopsis dassonvillei TaxID=2014 RepID=UPI00200C7195|nr:sigma-70 family RNA polymerase sigma factor [Nocardiopsis dassonvillei]MCK9872520.1 sigma-70 family RNA polymerase sigma factor [Nocardiopsis dassonvillei]
MNGQIELADHFERSRRHLRGVAFRMLGSAAEADDALQETWIRACRGDFGEVSNMTGWLTTIVGRVCLDMLRSRKSRREEFMDVSDIEPLLAQDRIADPEGEAVLADSVGLALLVVLDRLSPAERVAFVLHDLFAVPFVEIAEIVERTPTAAKKMASRARQRVQGTTSVPEPDLTRQREVVDAFLDASRAGDLDGLLKVLAPDVVRRADPQALRLREPAVLRGARQVAGETANNVRRTRFARPALVNGVPGAVVAPGGRLLFVLEITVRGDRVSGIEIIGAPERLRELEISVADPA